MNQLLAVLVVLLILLIFIGCHDFRENFDSPSHSWVKLYENYRQQNDLGTWSWNYEDGPYLKQLIPIQLKSYDIKVDVGSVEIWGLYTGSPTASTTATGVAGFGDAYTDPSQAYNAIGDAKYKKLVTVRSGEHAIADITIPVKRILIIVRFSK
jgi:hypothetical protein